MYCKTVKSILAFIICISVVFSCFGVMSVSSAESDNADVAVINLVENLRMSNFSGVSYGKNNNVQYATRAGTTAWVMNNSGADSDALYFDLNDEFAFEVKDGTEFDIDVEYYSQDDGYFQLRYDAELKDEKYGELCFTGNDARWNTQRFTLRDAYFGNRLGGKYDFMISIKAISSHSKVSPANIIIRKITVTKRSMENPATFFAYTDEAGNIFSDYQKDKVIHIDFENKRNVKQDFKIDYRVKSTSGYVRIAQTIDASLEPMEKKTVDIPIELTICDLYDLSIKITYSDGKAKEFENICRFAVVKTDPDGIRNEVYYANTHFENNHEFTDEAADVLVKMNANGVRVNFGWRFVEPRQGVFEYQEYLKKGHDSMRAKNVDMLVCINHSPTFWTGVDDKPPETDEQLARWAEAVEYILEIMPESTKFEIWNEPMGSLIRTGTANLSPEGFTKLTDIAIDVIRDKRPEAEIGIFSICGVVRDDVYNDWFLPAMNSKYEVWKDADAMAIHPYSREASDSAEMALTVDKYLKEFRAKGRDDIKVWNTELGFTPVDEESGNMDKRTDFNIRGYLYLLGEGMNDLYAGYGFERKGVVETDREDMFGIVSPGQRDTIDHYGKVYVPTETYVATAAQNYIMPQAKCIEKCRISDPEVKAYRYRSGKFNKDIVSIWSMEEDKQMSFDLGTNKVTYYDIYGNSEELVSDNGIYTFDVTSTPFYLMANNLSVREQDNLNFKRLNQEVVVTPNDFFAIELEKSVDGNFELVSDIPECFTEIENKGYSDNKAKIVYKVGESLPEFANFRINEIKDGKVYRVHDINPIINVESVKPNITVEPASKDVLNRWIGTLNIQNYSEYKVASGYVEFNSPQEFADLGRIDIGIIPKGKTAAIKFNCPTTNKLGIYSLDYDVVLKSGERYNYTQIIDFTVGQKRKKEIVIDGNIEYSEWNKNSTMFSESIEQIQLYSDWAGTEDLSGKYIISWDEENFYMAAEVTDDIFCNDEPEDKSWRGDSLQVGIYRDIYSYLISGHSYENFEELALSLRQGEPTVYRHKTQTGETKTGRITDGVELAVKRGEGKTYYEFKSTWKALLGYDYTPVDGERLYFSALINENDGYGRRGYMEYASGIGTQKNVNLFTKLILLDPQLK